MANLIIWTNVDVEYTRGLGAHQLAGWCRAHGYDVRVIDFCEKFDAETLLQLTSKHIDSDTVGIGVSSTLWRSKNSQSNFGEPEWVIDGRTLVADKFPNLKWLLGGTEVSHQRLIFNWIKFIGYSEDSLLKFLDESTNNKTIRSNFEIQTLAHSFIKEDCITPDEVLPIELSRGCQFKCKFCHYPNIGKKKNTYLRNFDCIKEEFIYNYETFGTTRYMFVDDTFNESEEKTIGLADLVKSLPFKLEWVGYNRLDLIGSRPGHAEMLAESGLKSAFFGIESFHPEAAKASGKGWNAKHGKEYLLKLKNEIWKDDINFLISLIVGLPGETEKDINDTRDWLVDNNMPRWHWHPLNINTKSYYGFQSEFEKDHELYGYSKPNKNRPSFWKSNLWTSDYAIIKANDLKILDEHRQHFAGFEVGASSTIGYSFDEIKATTYKNFDHDNYEIKGKQFIENYISRWLNS
jgi:radical SAM superfamily enzyme YgiQ (UPF0313 family)